MKTTTTAIANALIRARKSGGISESELTSLVSVLTDGAMALDVDAEKSLVPNITKKSSELLSELATEIDERS